MRPGTDTGHKGLFPCYLQPGQSLLKSSYEPIRSNAHTKGVGRVQIKTRLSNLLIPASPLTGEQNLLYHLIPESPGPAYLLVAPGEITRHPTADSPGLAGLRHFLSLQKFRPDPCAPLQCTADLQIITRTARLTCSCTLKGFEICCRRNGGRAEEQ